MRILHTSDWHVGKLLRGASRLDEHRRVLAEIAQVAIDQRVDLILVVGDVFESAAPLPEAQQLAWEALLALRATGAELVVVAGNHDHAAAFEAVRPVFAQLGITVAGHVARPEAGGVLEREVNGEQFRIALFPWLSRQHVLRAELLMDFEGSEVAQVYAAKVHGMIERLCANFTPDAVNLIAAHAYVRGGTRGGGERIASLVDEYFIAPHSFPATASYVALGHLHKRQRVEAGVPLWYCGSPIQVDFGDDAERRGVNIVEVRPGTPPKVEVIELRTPATLATISGSLSDLPAIARAANADHLRVVVDEAPRPGLADDVRTAIPNAVDITIRERERERERRDLPDARHHMQQSPRDLFGEYLDSVSAARDPALLALFDRLHEAATTP
jgi:exonuclease SbcD